MSQNQYIGYGWSKAYGKSVLGSLAFGEGVRKFRGGVRTNPPLLRPAYVPPSCFSCKTC